MLTRAMNKTVVCTKGFEFLIVVISFLRPIVVQQRRCQEDLGYCVAIGSKTRKDSGQYRARRGQRRLFMITDDYRFDSSSCHNVLRSLARDYSCPEENPRHRVDQGKSVVMPFVLPHLITFSARIITTGGIVSPSALAVFRLISSSNLVGCSTGRSAGLEPFRILST